MSGGGARKLSRRIEPGVGCVDVEAGLSIVAGGPHSCRT